MTIGETIDGFESMPARLVGEREDRLHRARSRLQFYVGFLDDCLRGVLQNDLVLLGAPTGMGKTDLALNIAATNAMNGRRVHYFALEAEPRELERRTKYALISRELFRTRHEARDRLNYSDWYLGTVESDISALNAWADDQILEKLSTLHTYYRGARFTAEDLQKAVMAVHSRSQLIVIDHLHYVDSDDENEARSLGDTVKTIRDVSLRIGVPILLVAHLRKRDSRAKQLIATLDDFHGSSNVTKIATQVIAIERASCVEPDKWYLHPTFMSVLKDRRAGAPRLSAVCMFDQRTRSYASAYRLGRISGAEWEEVPAHEVPDWAKHAERGPALTMKGRP